jgi:hypothetical protein
MWQDRIDDAMALLVSMTFIVVLAGMEWWRFIRRDSFHPWVYSIMALITIGVTARKLVKFRAESKHFREGRDGERLVAESLEELRTDGFFPMHDIVAGDFNLDHVLIGPHGIFAIETKTLQKRGGREEKAEFDGQQIRIQGATLRRDPVAQAQANAGWLRDFLRESTAREFCVTPVVILPGWFVAAKAPMRDVFVLNENPKGLRSYLCAGDPYLSAEDVALVRTHLRLFIRAKK